MTKKYTIQNHVIFGQVMKRPNIAKKCIERVLGIKDWRHSGPYGTSGPWIYHKG